MCQHSTKISGRLNIMLISTTMQLQNGLQLAQLNAGPATGVVFQRPHLHNKTEMAFSNFDLLQNSKDFNSRGQQNSLQWRWASSSSSAPASGYTRRFYEFWLPSTPVLTRSFLRWKILTQQSQPYHIGFWSRLKLNSWRSMHAQRSSYSQCLSPGFIA